MISLNEETRKVETDRVAIVKVVRERWGRIDAFQNKQPRHQSTSWSFLNHHFACHEATKNVCKRNTLNPRIEISIVSNIIYMYTSAWQKNGSSFLAKLKERLPKDSIGGSYEWYWWRGKPVGKWVIRIVSDEAVRLRRKSLQRGCVASTLVCVKEIVGWKQAYAKIALRKCSHVYQLWFHSCTDCVKITGLHALRRSRNDQSPYKGSAGGMRLVP